ncbi:MAG: hypothetical protein AB7I30_08465 [Isosphaeraceae bacterium]
MGDYLRLLTVSDREIPLVTIRRAAHAGAVWSVDHPGMLGNYLAIGPEINVIQNVWATIERNPVGPNTLGAEEVADFLDRLDAGGPPAASRWLADYLESVRAIYAIRIYPEAIGNDQSAIDTVDAVRNALREVVGGIGQWDGQGFTNESDHLIWCNPDDNPQGTTTAALLDESTGEWLPFEINLSDPEELSAFIRGEQPRSGH